MFLRKLKTSERSADSEPINFRLQENRDRGIDAYRIMSMSTNSFYGFPLMSIEQSTQGKLGSKAYAITLSLACVGLPFLGIGLGGELIALSGGDPIDALDVDGMVMFILAFAMSFSARLMFWPPVPAKLRAFVRTTISVVFAISFVASVAGVILIWKIPAALNDKEIPIIFSVLALLCQPCTVLWLLRYRTEGL